MFAVVAVGCSVDSNVPVALPSNGFRRLAVGWGAWLLVASPWVAWFGDSVFGGGCFSFRLTGAQVYGSSIVCSQHRSTEECPRALERRTWIWWGVIEEHSPPSFALTPRGRVDLLSEAGLGRGIAPPPVVHGRGRALITFQHSCPNSCARPGLSPGPPAGPNHQGLAPMIEARCPCLSTSGRS